MFDALSEMVRERKSGGKPKPKPERGAGPRFAPYEFFLGKTAVEIPARTTSELCDKGRVDLWRFDADGKLIETSDFVNAWNWLNYPIPSGEFVRVGQHPHGKWLIIGPEFSAFVLKTDEEIPAMSSSTPGSGDASLYYIADSGELTDTGETRTVYNLASEAVASGAWIQAERDSLSGKLLITWEDCG
jgi:hypothetical protein